MVGGYLLEFAGEHWLKDIDTLEEYSEELSDEENMYLRVAVDVFRCLQFLSSSPPIPQDCAVRTEARWVGTGATECLWNAFSPTEG